jgi:hypothetical protein
MASPISSRTTASVYFDPPQDPESRYATDSNEILNVGDGFAHIQDVSDPPSGNLYDDGEAHHADDTTVDPYGLAGWLPVTDVPDKKPARKRSVLKKPKPQPKSPAASISSRKNAQLPSRTSSLGGRSARNVVPEPEPEPEPSSNGAAVWEPNAMHEQSDHTHVRIASTEAPLAPMQQQSNSPDCRYSESLSSYSIFLIYVTTQSNTASVSQRSLSKK